MSYTLRMVPIECKRAFNSLAIYTMWNLSKELNCRIFDNIHSTALQIVGRIKENLDLHKLKEDTVCTPGP
jgi:hypothetical protein